MHILKDHLLSVEIKILSLLDDIYWPKIAVISIVYASVTLVLQVNSSFSFRCFSRAFLIK